LAVLLSKALSPEQIVAIHVDNGFMRFEESEEVKITLKKAGIDLKIVD
jgi:GMP synthase (glutamine-hydrolysing)